MNDETKAGDVPENLGPHVDTAGLDALEREAAESTPEAVAEAAAEAADDMPTGEVLRMVIGPAAAILAPNWNLSDAEVEQLSDAYAAVMDKYMPGGLGEFGPELGAALVTVAILAPRLNRPRKLPPKPADDASTE